MEFDKMKEIAGEAPAQLRAQIMRDLSIKSSSAQTTNAVTFAASAMSTTYCLATSSVGGLCATGNIQIVSSIANTTLATPSETSPRMTTKAQIEQQATCSFQVQAGYKRKNRALGKDGKKGKLQLSAAPYELPTRSNRFEALAQEEMDIEDMITAQIETNSENINDNSAEINSSESQETIVSPLMRLKKPSPICVPDCNNIDALDKALRTALGPDSFSFSLSKGGVTRIQTVDSTGYRAVVKILTEKNCKFWHHQLAEEKPFRLVVRKIHASVGSEKIKNYFMDMGHSVLNIHCPRKPDWSHSLNENQNDSDTRQSCFFVNIKKAPNNLDALKITKIGPHNVVVEVAKKSKDIVQCFRCQDFGHTKNYCLQRPVCGKCGEDHPTNHADCKIRPTDKLYCANCGGDHPASFKECKYRQLKLKSMKPNPRLPSPGKGHKKDKAATSNYFIPAQAVRSGYSYSEALQGSSAPQTPAQSCQNKCCQNIPAQTLVAHSASEGTKRLDTLENALINLTSKVDQMFALFSHGVDGVKQ